MKFSQKMGLTPIRTALQINSVDNDLKNALWNIILDEFIDKIKHSYEELNLEVFYQTLWIKFFKKAIDDIPHYRRNSFEDRTILTDEVLKIIRDWYFKCQWFEVYDFLEFLSMVDRAYGKWLNFDDNCNAILKNELSGFRVIDGYAVQIISEVEIAEIEEAINDTNQLDNVNTHLITALSFLADRKKPNYRNSIKESISAVEALCAIIVGDKDATFSKALAIIEAKHSLHPALKKSFGSLYGYTSDASGIRHALIENDTQVNFEEAKFMLVSCSAFINFLKAKFTEK